MGNTTKLRDELLRELSGIRQENEARIGDPYFSSSTGYNMADLGREGLRAGDDDRRNQLSEGRGERGRVRCTAQAAAGGQAGGIRQRQR